MTHYAGLDVSMTSTAICVVDSNGSIITEGVVDSSPDAIAKFLLKTKLTYNVVGLETGPISPHLSKELLEFGLPVTCIDAKHLHAFLSVKVNKTDQNDARGIAEVLRCGAYKSVHVKSNEALNVSAIVNLREALVEARVKLTNTLRGIMKPLGIRSLGSSSSGIQFIQRCREALELLQPSLQVACESIFEALKMIYLKIKSLDEQLEQLCEKDEQIKLLMTAPGVGPVTALRFKHAIDEVERFEDPKAVGAYFGLTPTQYSSGEIHRQGRISRCGSKQVRKSLVAAANALLTRTKSWSKLKAWGLKIQRKKGFRKAVVAVARKLAVILYRMLKTGEQFQHAGMAVKAA